MRRLDDDDRFGPQGSALRVVFQAALTDRPDPHVDQLHGRTRLQTARLVVEGDGVGDVQRIRRILGALLVPEPRRLTLVTPAIDTLISGRRLAGNSSSKVATEKASGTSSPRPVERSSVLPYRQHSSLPRPRRAGMCCAVPQSGQARSIRVSRNHQRLRWRKRKRRLLVFLLPDWPTVGNDRAARELPKAGDRS